jgi:predicted transcriptional regulator
MQTDLMVIEDIVTPIHDEELAIKNNVLKEYEKFGGSFGP